jgi:hypothetical protein
VGTGLTVTVRVDGARETLAALRRLPRQADQELRDASMRIAQLLASRIQAAARGDSRQSALIAPTVRIRRELLPTVVAGGAVRVGRRRKPAYKILFGSEFGSNRLPQFRPHLGRGSYWFFRTVEDNETAMGRQWRQAADAVVRSFGGP